LGRELERLRRERRVSRSLTLAELVEVYLVQHDVEPVTIEKLRWLLGKAVSAFGLEQVFGAVPHSRDGAKRALRRRIVFASATPRFAAPHRRDARRR
jgi:hypothetical protein